MSEISNYRKLIDAEPTQEAIARMAAIKDTLKIRDDDALWSIILILEMYMKTIGDFNAKTKRSILEALIQYAEAGGVIKYSDGKDEDERGSKKISLTILVVLVGYLVLFGVIMFVAGATLNEFSPEWVRGSTVNDSARLLGYILGAPAGWILFLFVPLPSTYMIFSQLRVIRSLETGRKLESLGLIVVAVLSILLSATVLIRLI